MQSFFGLKKFSILSTKFYSHYAEDLSKKKEKDWRWGLIPRPHLFYLSPVHPLFQFTLSANVIKKKVKNCELGKKLQYMICSE